MEENLIVVKQLPVIEEQLKMISDEIDKEVEKALALECTEGTIQEVKDARSGLNKKLKSLEDRRGEVKKQVESPYLAFLEIYKKYVTEKFAKADKDLKERIENVEKEVKLRKEEEVKDYFKEYLSTLNNIDFITYEKVGINITLTASKKSLKDQVKTYLDKIQDDLELIDTQEHKAEILVEYKQSLNVSQAITSVSNRMKAIEEEKQKNAEREVLNQKIVEASVGVIKVPVEEVKVIEKVTPVIESNVTAKFMVTTTLIKLKELKAFMVERGIKYE